MLDEFQAAASRFQYQPPQIPLVSNLTGRLIDDEPLDAAYWRRHIRNPVQFAQGMRTLAEQGLHAMLEVGPTASLLGMGRRCLPDLQVLWLPSLRKGQEDWPSLLASLSELYLLGAKIDWPGFDRDYPRQRLILPTYPFERERYWFEPTKSPRALVGGRPRARAAPAAGQPRPVGLADPVVRGPPELPLAQVPGRSPGAGIAGLPGRRLRGAGAGGGRAGVRPGAARAREPVDPARHVPAGRRSRGRCRWPCRRVGRRMLVRNVQHAGRGRSGRGTLVAARLRRECAAGRRFRRADVPWSIWTRCAAAASRRTRTTSSTRTSCATAAWSTGRLSK